MNKLQPLGQPTWADHLLLLQLTTSCSDQSEAASSRLSTPLYTTENLNPLFPTARRPGGSGNLPHLLPSLPAEIRSSPTASTPAMAPATQQTTQGTPPSAQQQPEPGPICAFTDALLAEMEEDRQAMGEVILALSLHLDSALS